MSVIAELRAPAQDRAIVAVPSFSDLPAIIEKNRQTLRKQTLQILGSDLHELRNLARTAIVQASRDYLAKSGERVPEFSSESLLLAGHQPELFHPGVWVKNFALHKLARQHGAAPVNLVVDNDAIRSTAINVPHMICPPPPIETFRPSLAAIAFDRWSMEVPYEERTVHDEEFFREFPNRVEHDWDFEPFLPRFWREVLTLAERTNLLGERFAAARRSFERAWGCHNLEIPVSKVCQTGPFAWFACHLLSELPRFRNIYNDAVHRYRQRNRIRSRNHPVPDLTIDGDWVEAPFWGWRQGENRRGRLFVRAVADRMELRNGDQNWPALPSCKGRSSESISRAWRELHEQGYKIRSRALTNTLFARMFLGDLFIHGIGGGKYDELTDQIMQEFYGVTPPDYMVLSATLHLPFPHYDCTPNDVRRLHQELRDLHFNPQRHLRGSEAAEATTLVQRKLELIATVGQTRRQRRERFHQLREVTKQLRRFVADEEEAIRQQLEHCQQEVEANEILQRRDYAFCLYPEQLLQEFCTQFLRE